MGIISLIVHTWGGVDKSHAVRPRGGPCILTMRLMRGTFYFIPCFCNIEINLIHCILCGLSPIYVAPHEPGCNSVCLCVFVCLCVCVCLCLGLQCRVMYTF